MNNFKISCLLLINQNLDSVQFQFNELDSIQPLERLTGRDCQSKNAKLIQSKN